MSTLGTVLLEIRVVLVFYALESTNYWVTILDLYQTRLPFGLLPFRTLNFCQSPIEVGPNTAETNTVNHLHSNLKKDLCGDPF